MPTNKHRAIVPFSVPYFSAGCQIGSQNDDGGSGGDGQGVEEKEVSAAAGGTGSGGEAGDAATPSAEAQAEVQAEVRDVWFQSIRAKIWSPPCMYTSTTARLRKYKIVLLGSVASVRFFVKVHYFVVLSV